jgi:hypothetical protein
LQSVSTADACRMMANAQLYGGGSVAAGHVTTMLPPAAPHKPKPSGGPPQGISGAVMSWWHKVTSQ